MRDLFDDFMDELRRREAAARGEDPGPPRSPDREPGGTDDADEDTDAEAVAASDADLDTDTDEGALGAANGSTSLINAGSASIAASNAATSAMPPARSQRLPYRSESLPAIGAVTMIRTVIGRNLTPVSSGDRRRMSCM